MTSRNLVYICNAFVICVVMFVYFQNNHLSIEEFHSKLQEATNFPLRPFVIPFLKVSDLQMSFTTGSQLKLML